MELRKDDWIQQFFLPMFERCWKGLNPGEELCLNIPAYIYEYLPPCDEIKELLNRDMEYVWRKPSTIDIRPSPVHGVGLFARTNIPKNTRLYNYTGEELKWSDFRSRYGRDYRYSYCMPRVQKIITAKETPYREYNFTNFVNESLNPNVCLRRRGLYTLRDIEEGEELFLRYGKNYPRDYSLFE